MSTSKRLVQMILRGQADKFKNVLQEELKERAGLILEELYKNQSSVILDSIVEEAAVITVSNQENSTPNNTIKEEKFIPQSTYKLKDGGIGILTDAEKTVVSKLYESLNNNNKERMVKLLSESQESFNRILKLAKSQNKQ